MTHHGLGAHAFRDAREHDVEHPFNQEVHQGASVLVVGLNFGCGSSREHAPESLKQWGIRAIVGGSFAEIFFGNCVMLGIPCLAASMDDIAWLQREIGKNPGQPIEVDVVHQVVRFGDRAIPARIPPGAHHQLVSGTWNTTRVLLEAGDGIETTANRLPYVRGY